MSQSLSLNFYYSLTQWPERPEPEPLLFEPELRERLEPDLEPEREPLLLFDQEPPEHLEPEPEPDDDDDHDHDGEDRPRPQWWRPWEWSPRVYIIECIER